MKWIYSCSQLIGISLAETESAGAIPFDVPNVELSHVGVKCSFDSLLKIFPDKSSVSGLG